MVIFPLAGEIQMSQASSHNPFDINRKRGFHAKIEGGVGGCQNFDLR